MFLMEMVTEMVTSYTTKLNFVHKVNFLRILGQDRDSETGRLSPRPLATALAATTVHRHFFHPVFFMVRPGASAALVSIRSCLTNVTYEMILE
jgi:hypothetical protein